jgi:hypothetical protein
VSGPKPGRTAQLLDLGARLGLERSARRLKAAVGNVDHPARAA